VVRVGWCSALGSGDGDAIEELYPAATLMDLAPIRQHHFRGHAAAPSGEATATAASASGKGEPSSAGRERERETERERGQRRGQGGLVLFERDRVA
jgi:hypothetical protein